MEESMDKQMSRKELSAVEYKLINEIIKVRLENNLTQKDLSRLTRISQPNIARYEKNIHSASLATTLRVLNALGYTLKIEKIKHNE